MSTRLYNSRLLYYCSLGSFPWMLWPIQTTTGSEVTCIVPAREGSDRFPWFSLIVASFGWSLSEVSATREAAQFARPSRDLQGGDPRRQINQAPYVRDDLAASERPFPTANPRRNSGVGIAGPLASSSDWKQPTVGWSSRA